MKKTLLFSLISSALLMSPAMAQQNAMDSTAATGNSGDYGNSSWRTTETNLDYMHQDGQGNQELAPQGWSNFTNAQGSGSSPNAPFLYGANSGDFSFNSGAATGAPIPGTFRAPGNLALKSQGLKDLPPTRLDSFVRNSGYNDRIYGDEGTEGPPPYFGFDSGSRIERGIFSGGLSTGHRSDAPSAWGWPH